MKKDFRVSLDDIVSSCDKIDQYLQGKDKEDLEVSSELQDAVIRRLEVIGEAVKRLPQEFRNQHADISWKEAAGMRDVLIHAYDEVDLDQVWVTVQNVLPSFKESIHKLLQENSS